MNLMKGFHLMLRLTVVVYPIFPRQQQRKCLLYVTRNRQIGKLNSYVNKAY